MLEDVRVGDDFKILQLNTAVKSCTSVVDWWIYDFKTKVLKAENASGGGDRTWDGEGGIGQKRFSGLTNSLKSRVKIWFCFLKFPDTWQHLSSLSLQVCIFHHIESNDQHQCLWQECQDANDLMAENPQPSARNEFRKKISQVGCCCSCPIYFSWNLSISWNSSQWLDNMRLICNFAQRLSPNEFTNQKNYQTKNHQGQMSSSSRWASLVGRSGSPKTSSSRSMRTSRKKIGQISQTSMVIFSMRALQSWQKGSFCVFSTSSKDNFCSLKPFIEGTRLQKESQI